MDQRPEDRAKGAHGILRRGLLQRAAAGLAVAGGGVLLGAGVRDTEAAPSPAVQFGELVAGNGPIALRLVNRSTAAAASGLRADMSAASPGNDAAAVRGVMGGANANTNAVLGVHRGKGAGLRGTSAAGTGVAGSSVQGPGVMGKTKNGDRGVYGVTDNEAGFGVYGQASGGGGAGVFGTNNKGAGVWGKAAGNSSGVFGQAEGAGSRGVRGATNTGVAGVVGEHSGGGYGVLGLSHAAGGQGVRGYSTSGAAGVYDKALYAYGSGVYGWADGSGASGVFGRSERGTAVWGSSGDATGVRGQSSGVSGRGVHAAAYGTNAIGVHAETLGSESVGVYAASRWHGVLGITSADSGAGVIGRAKFVGVQGSTTGTTNGGQGVRGEAPNTTAWAGYFDGKVGARNGYTGATSTFAIDHPLAPADRTLRHSYVAAPEMKNIYDGVVTTSSSGNATVALPAYFEALNRDFRYQLTVVGGLAQAFVSKEIAGGRFEISTDRPGVKVSWMVTGVRRDAYATKHGLAVEEAKTGADRGRYLHPEEHGQLAAMAVPLHSPAGGAVATRPEVPAAVQEPVAPRDDP